MKVLVIIPAYNEEESLPTTVDELTRVCPDVDYLVINDGSTDATEAFCVANDINHVRLPINTGLASGFRAGMKYAYRHGYDAAIQFDADGQHMPDYIMPMAQTLAEQDADIVIASRVLAGEGVKGMRGVGSKLITLLIRLTTGTVITDPTSGMRMYGARMIERFAQKGFDLAPEPDTVALIARKGGKVVEVPALMRERQGGESYLKFGSIIRYMSRTCLSILLFQWFR